MIRARVGQFEQILERLAALADDEHTDRVPRAHSADSVYEEASC